MGGKKAGEFVEDGVGERMIVGHVPMAARNNQVAFRRMVVWVANNESRWNRNRKCGKHYVGQ